MKLAAVEIKISKVNQKHRAKIDNAINSGDLSEIKDNYQKSTQYTGVYVGKNIAESESVLKLNHHLSLEDNAHNISPGVYFITMKHGQTKEPRGRIEPINAEEFELYEIWRELGVPDPEDENLLTSYYDSYGVAHEFRIEDISSEKGVLFEIFENEEFKIINKF